jgi:hypothetical protein
MRSSWEVKVAKWLDENHIKWEYESKSCVFKLCDGHTYLVDFYLPELNKHIEVKGWWKISDIEKFNEAKEKIDICIVDYRNLNNIDLDLKEVPNNDRN